MFFRKISGGGLWFSDFHFLWFWSPKIKKPKTKREQRAQKEKQNQVGLSWKNFVSITKEWMTVVKNQRPPKKKVTAKNSHVSFQSGAIPEGRHNLPARAGKNYLKILDFLINLLQICIKSMPQPEILEIHIFMFFHRRCAINNQVWNKPIRRARTFWRQF